MYRERKRYKPTSPTLRRAMYNGSRALLLLLAFLLFQSSLAPTLQAYLADQIVEGAGMTISQRGDTLDPVIPVSASPRTAFTLSLNQEQNAGSLGGDGLFVTSDPRVIAMRQYLIDRNSPMYPYAEVFVTEADKYGLDWRLLVAISGVESVFGNIIPPGSHNAWGWKGDPTREWSHFTSWRHAIEVITERMALGYGIDLTPFDIEATYCPPCGQTPGHPWANGVTRFMNEMDAYVHNL